MNRQFIGDEKTKETICNRDRKETIKEISRTNIEVLNLIINVTDEQNDEMVN